MVNNLSIQQSLLSQTTQLIHKCNFNETSHLDLGLDAINQKLMKAENELDEARVGLFNASINTSNVKKHLEGIANMVNSLRGIILPSPSSCSEVEEIRNNYQQLQGFYLQEAKGLITQLESSNEDLESIVSLSTETPRQIIDFFNERRDHPIGLEKNHIIHKEMIDFIDKGNQLTLSKEYPQALEKYTKALKIAEKKSFKSITVDVLVQISLWFKAQHQFSSAAKVLNGVFALFEADSKTSVVSITNILNNMITLEGSLINHLKSKYQLELTGEESRSFHLLDLAKQNIIRYRDTLRSTHDVIKTKMDDRVEIYDVQTYITETRKHIIDALVQDCFAVLGQPPCEYTFIGLGSFSRSEMCPYSDFEFAILIKDSSISNCNYFNALVELLELKVINLGETPFSILDEGATSPTPNGFCFDSGGNTPISKKLVGTVKEIAAFQHINSYKEDIILTNALASTCFICGNKTLFVEYERTIWQSLETIYNKVHFRKIRALELLKGHVIEFQPRLDTDKEKTGLLDAKKELYRLPSIALEALALYLKIPEKNSFLRVRALLEKKLITSLAAENLKFLLTVATRLRIECHLFYKNEKEFLLNPEIKKDQNEGEAKLFKVLTESQLHEISKCYLILYPFLDALDAFCKTTSLTQFSANSFFSDHFDALAEAYLQTGRFSDALDLYQRNLSLHPNKEKGIFEFANVLFKKGMYSSAVGYLSKIINEENASIITVRAHNLMGEAYFLQEFSTLAYQHFITALYHLIELKQAGKYPQIIKNGLYPTVLNNLGNMYLKANHIQYALECFDTAYVITKYESFLTHEKLPEIMGNIGKCDLATHDFTSAISYFDRSCKIAQKILSPAIEKARYNENLGLLHYKQKKISKALSYYEKACALYLKAGHSAHPRLGECYFKMAKCAFKNKKSDKALKYLEEKLPIDKINNLNRDQNIMTTLAFIAKIERSKNKKFNESILEKRLQELVSEETWRHLTDLRETIYNSRVLTVFEEIDSYLSTLYHVDSKWILSLDSDEINFTQFVLMPTPYLFMLEKEEKFRTDNNEMIAKQYQSYLKNCMDYLGMMNFYTSEVPESDEQRIFRASMSQAGFLTSSPIFKSEDFVRFADIAIQTDYRDLYAFLFRAKAKIRQRKFTEAIEDLQEVLNLDNKADQANFLMGNCYFILQDISRSLKEFQECSRLAPNFSQAINLEAICHWKLGNYQTAYKLFDKLDGLPIKKEELSIITANQGILALYCDDIEMAQKTLNRSCIYYNENKSEFDLSILCKRSLFESEHHFLPSFHCPIVNFINMDILEKLDRNNRDYIEKLREINFDFLPIFFK